MASTVETLQERAREMAETARELAGQAEAFAGGLGDLPVRAAEAGQAAAGGDAGHNLVVGLTVFVLAIFVGYHVVWRVTPALHSPLMAVTNAVSSVIIVGALIAAGPGGFSFSEAMGLIAIALAAVNIFGGFIVTQRMLAMFMKKK